jgi:hypothetical protein
LFLKTVFRFAVFKIKKPKQQKDVLLFTTQFLKFKKLLKTHGEHAILINGKYVITDNFKIPLKITTRRQHDAF